MISISRADWLVRLLMTKRRGRKVPPTNEAEPQEEEEEEAKKEKHLMASQVGGMLTNSPIILFFLLRFRLCGRREELLKMSLPHHRSVPYRPCRPLTHVSIGEDAAEEEEEEEVSPFSSFPYPSFPSPHFRSMGGVTPQRAFLVLRRRLPRTSVGPSFVRRREAALSMFLPLPPLTGLAHKFRELLHTDAYPSLPPSL